MLEARGILVGCLFSALLVAPAARAEVYSYVDWTSADVASGTASGIIILPDDSSVQVTFAATNEDGSAGTLHGAQLDGGTNFWSPSTPYISAEVENPPPTPDILQLAGGLNQTYTVQLSEPIKDPLMAIVSLGQPGILCTYDFDAPFSIVSQGVGYWGGSDAALSAMPGDVLEGYEGHGTLRFLGTFTRFSWTVPTPESWHGFTFAIRTTEALEPTPGAGGGGGGGAGGTADPGSAGEDGASGSDGGFGGEGGQAGASVVAGATSAEGGNDDGSSSGGRAEGGQSDRDFSSTRQDAGCDCSLSPTSLGYSLAAPALMLLALGLRRRRGENARP